MSCQDDSEAVVSPAGRGIGTVAIAIATALAIGGCSLTTAAAPPKILNTERIERAIEQATLAQRDKRINVSCPSGVVQKKGVVFTCSAVYNGGGGQFVVTELDGAGAVHYVAQ
jgi:uncharacterized protein DUF4333